MLSANCLSKTKRQARKLLAKSLALGSKDLRCRYRVQEIHGEIYADLRAMNCHSLLGKVGCVNISVDTRL